MTVSGLLPLVAALIAFPGVREATAAGAAPSTLIINASVLDGSGAEPRLDRVRIEGERIVAVGALEPRAGEAVLDARGLVLAPGFIDTHSHHDIGLFEQRDALAAVSQGITTIIVGQDGSLEYPLEQLERRLKRTPVAVNVGAYLGHGTLRAAVMRDDFRRAAHAREIGRMRALVAAGMRAGALGLSTGLEYDPGIYATKDEVLQLAAEAARYGGRYISHIRSEDRDLWQALDEAVEIGRVNRMPVQISHMKLAMTDWWGQAERFLAVLERARAAGVEVTGDVYPYEHWQSSITVLFPQRNFTERAAAEFALRSLVQPQDLLITRFDAEPVAVGRTLEEIARARGVDAVTALLGLLAQWQERGGQEEVIARSMRADDIAKLISWPHANICSDGALRDTHPRGAGSFTRVLREYVRERGVLTLAAAVHKMTGAAAAHVGIRERGLVRPGAAADLVLFDPERVADRATFAQPTTLSAGIAKVWVNGAVVFADGAAGAIHPGRFIRRPAL